MEAKKQITRAFLKGAQPLRIFKSWKFTSPIKFTVTGYSRAADRTFLHVPELKIGLDCGYCRGRQPEWVFLTHSHSDHSKDVDYMCQREGGMYLYCPIEAVPFIAEFVPASIALNNCSPFDAKKYSGDSSESTEEKGKGRGDMNGRAWKITGVKGGDTFEFKNYLVTVFDCIHSVPCVGYGFSEKRKRLRPEFKGLDPKDLKKIRESGVDMNESFTLPLFVYLGDTHISVFKRNPSLFQYPNIIVECTFIGETVDDEKLAKKLVTDGHIHWSQLQPIVLAHPEITFLLIHFSLRYSEQEVFDFFDRLVSRAENPLALDNVVIFIGEHSEGRRDG